MKKGHGVCYLIASITLFALIWQLLAIMVNSPLFPRITIVLKTTLKLLFSMNTYINLSSSVLLVLEAFILSLFLSFPIAVICYKFIRIPKIILPIHEFIRYIPVPAFVPLCAAIFGVEDLTKVVLIFIGTYFQQIFLFINDLQAPQKEIEETARTLGIKGLKLITKINIPASMPMLMDSIRITFAWAWSYLLVAEVVNARKGIGYLVLQSYRLLNMERLVSYVIIIGIFGVLMDFLFKLLKKKLCSWDNSNNRN